MPVRSVGKEGGKGGEGGEDHSSRTCHITHSSRSLCHRSIIERSTWYLQAPGSDDGVEDDAAGRNRDQGHQAWPRCRAACVLEACIVGVAGGVWKGQDKESEEGRQV